MVLNTYKELRETTERLRSIFVNPTYYIRLNGQKFVLYEPNDPKTELFLDVDGALLGVPNYQINFFVFPKGKGFISMSEWYIEAIRGWCHEHEKSVIKREWTKSELEAIKYFRRFLSHSFVQYVLKEYPNSAIWDRDGMEIHFEDYRNSVF